MSATITYMQLIHADTLNVDQLMPGDIVKIEDDLLTVVIVEDTEMGYKITTINEFGEEDSVEVSDESKFDLFVFPAD